MTHIGYIIPYILANHIIIVIPHTNVLLHKNCVPSFCLQVNFIDMILPFHRNLLGYTLYWWLKLLLSSCKKIITERWKKTLTSAWTVVMFWTSLSCKQSGLFASTAQKHEPLKLLSLCPFHALLIFTKF